MAHIQFKTIVMKKAIVWFRCDLRLTDHTALHNAIQKSAQIVPVFIFDPYNLQLGQTGDPQVAYFLQSLQSLNLELQKVGSKLILRHGNPIQEMEKLIEETKVESLFWNIDQEPYARKRDSLITEMCKRKGISVFTFHDSTLQHSDAVLKSNKEPYTVFTPYRKRWENMIFKECLPKPSHISTPRSIKTIPLPNLADFGFSNSITLPSSTEVAVLQSLKLFCGAHLLYYKKNRNVLTNDMTSKFSIPLRAGIISIRTIFHAVLKQKQKFPKCIESIDAFLAELCWRDFYKMIMWHFPHVETESFQKKYQHLKWENNEKYFQAWCMGKTGFPIVDAGIRQLLQTGWMHNRLRMITASFLTKDLLIDWKWGEKFFRENLIDADLASNNGGWQWCASTGTDAQPFFRIFNPNSQAEKFDPEGKFIHQCIPELNTPEYPPPLVDHAIQRIKALKLFQKKSL
jgi:deoxyribodipyrimidine photo-lyase